MQTAALLAATLALGFTPGETRYRSVYFKGAQLGYSTVEEKAVTLDGQPAVQGTLRAVGVVEVGGKRYVTSNEAVAWYTPEERLLRYVSTNSGYGKRSRFEARLGPKAVEIDDDEGGAKTHRSLPTPEGPVFDSVEKAVPKSLATGATRTFWTLNNAADGFDRWELKAIGPATADLNGRKAPATLVEARSDGTLLRLYVDRDGILLREEYPFGVVDLAVSRETALALKNGPGADFLAVAEMKADHPLSADGTFVYGLKLRIVGDDLASVPSDESQTVTKDGDGWRIEVHPPEMQLRMDAPLAGVARGKEEWTRATPYLTSDDPKIRRTARDLVKGCIRVQNATAAIRYYVGGRMEYELGFGDARSATEILRQPKGKCTDYAILTTTLLRAAGIPARLVTGLVGNDEGSFGYHAWAEAWDGERWVGVDAVSDFDQVFASYVKLAQGNVEEAFRYPIPADPTAMRIQVLRVKPLNKPAIVYAAP